MGLIIFLVVAAFIMLFVFAFISAGKNIEKMDAQIASSSYTPDYTYPFPSGRLCVCQADRIVMLVYPDRTQYLSFDDILSVEMFIDGKSTYSRSTGKVIGASLIGGVIGAMCVDQDEKKTCTDLHVDIGTRIMGSPTITLQFVAFDTDDITLERKQAMDIVNTLKAVIDENEKLHQTQLAAAQAAAVAQAVQTVSPAVQPHSQIEEKSQTSVSVADEIRKCAALLEDGIITEAEFNDMKSALLKGNK